MNLSWTPPSYDGGAEVVGGPSVATSQRAEQFTASILFGPLKGDKKFCGNLSFCVKSEASEVLSDVSMFWERLCVFLNCLVC